MKQLMTSLPWLAGACAALLASSAAAQPSFYDAKVQTPQLSAPARGSIAGEYAQIALGPADVSRGSFSLPGPFDAPEDRGPLLASPFPSYSPGAGISEWGMGWKADSWSVSRWRARGELDFATDELTSPWGRLVRGADGAWYPAGLGARVRVEVSGTALTAYLPDGSTWSYGGSSTHVVETPRGIYSWLLREATSAEGEKTTFVYARSPSGRPYVQHVSYGGRGGTHQALIELGYETLSRPFVDMRSGMEQKLDWRVSVVRVFARHATSGEMVARWRYLLNYQEAVLGPAFYLSEVQQIFASGERAALVRYRYHTASEALEAAAFQPVPKLSDALAAWGDAAILPWRATLVDEDEDGRLDFEHSRSHALAVQEEAGFRVEELPPRGAGVEPLCRPPEGDDNEPRLLARMWPESAASHVVHVQPNASHTSADVRVCRRDGTLLAQQRLTGGWELGPNTRLVDINRDQKPDLLRVYEGGYEVLFNESSHEGALAFGAPRRGRISPAASPHTTWVHDVNGDTVADLVSRFDGGFAVWLGNGQSGFQTTAQVYPVRDANGVQISDLLRHSVTFVDANRDGLADALLSSPDVAALLVNSGRDFRETPVPGLRFYNGSTSVAVVGDLAGTGDTSLAVTRFGEAYALPVERPETGLLKSADDGKGTVLRFSYTRSPAGPGARQRYPVLESLQVESSGYEATEYVYDYAGPVHHSVGEFLVGFDLVTRRAGTATEEMSFLHDDVNAGLLLYSSKEDTLSPLLLEYGFRQYEDAMFQGLPFKRLKLAENGWQDASSALGAPVSEVSEVLEYTGELCPTRTRRTTASGTLETQLTLASPAALTRHLHCLEGAAALTGTHERPELDFRHEVQLSRNDIGLLEQVKTVEPGGGDQLVHQSVVYNPDFTVQSVSAPGRGTTTVAYDPAHKLLQRVTAPDGVAVEVTERHPVRDEVLALTTMRAARHSTQWFRYDGQERLAKQWSDQGAGSEADPQLQLRYVYATATRPGSIAATALVDASAGAKLDTLQYFTAAGEIVAEASRVGARWVFDGVITRDPGLRTVTHHTRPSLLLKLPLTNVSYTQLLQGAEWTGSVRADVWGTQVAALERLHADVERDVRESLSVGPDGVVSSVKDNLSEGGALPPARSWKDAGGRIHAVEDEAGNRTEFVHDALGRLREVALPDGSGHRVTYDVHGRVERVERDGIATVAYEYDPDTGLLVAKHFLSQGGEEVRSERWQHDAIGRATHEVHTDAASGDTQTYRFYYDGATPDQPAANDSPGLLTAVTGEGYTKLFAHRADGKIVRSTLTLAGWRTVETEVVRYTENDEIAEETTTVKDGSGQVLSAVTKRYGWTTYGALSSMRVNGQPLATFGYNALGQLDEVRFGSAGTVAFGYDPLTQERVSVAQTTAAQATSVGWRFNSRGLTDAEEVAIGASRWTRQYDYSAEGFLSAAEDAAATYAYTFDASGLPTSITEAGSTRTLVSHGDTLVAGSVVHTFDALGRTVMKGDLALAYGPNGQVERATRGASSWRFLYDEDGQRLAKLSAAGAPLAAYIGDDIYLDGSGLTEPVHVGGQLVGLLKNGVFQMLAVDRRGTVIADAGGTARLASPFGNRAVHPSDAAAVDYVEKGYDADLGVVRMGVRDYDPTINRFTTPDTLFLEEPDLCVASPVDCNLYGYARNRPLDFVDPEGTNPIGIGQQFLQRLLPMAQNAGPAAVQFVRQVGPAVAQAVRTRGPAAVQAVRQAAPGVMQMARRANERVQTLGKQAVEVSQRGAAQASHHARNAAEVTKRVIAKVAGKAQAAAPSQPAAPAVAARGLPNLPQSAGAAANITTTSRIGQSSYAVRQAEALSEAAQRDVDTLLGQLRAGNMNPGIGTRALGGGFFELRGANAGRAIVKQTGESSFDIVGKFQGHVRGDAGNSAIIQRLIGDYNAL
ncbi:RHS repeat-associated core domain-containing protein [Sorangium sp. So ce302]|uniref:RHS repeat-associated core domain-containing protein n=1 Tax=Sorangium sp. So ce302 TaxID=3133297 RepID=UPI003F615DEE